MVWLELYVYGRTTIRFIFRKKARAVVLILTRKTNTKNIVDLRMVLFGLQWPPMRWVSCFYDTNKGPIRDQYSTTIIKGDDASFRKLPKSLRANPAPLPIFRFRDKVQVESALFCLHSLPFSQPCCFIYLYLHIPQF